jgi:HD-GYP domain-containing protein (c-di-GMP phosphodiesterase class II)
VKTKFNITGNVLVYYTAIILFMVIAVSLLMGIVISRYQEKHLLLAHIEFYPELINIIVDKDPEILQKISDMSFSGLTSGKPVSAVDEIMAIKGISGTAIISNRGEIVAAGSVSYSAEELVTRPQFVKALSGETGYDYSGRGDSQSLEIFIPIITDTGVIGIVYLVEIGGHLTSVVHESGSTVWGVISLCGLLLYLFLFYLFYHSYRKQKTINEHLRQTQDVTIFALGYQAELRDLETGKHIERTSAYVEILANELKRHGKYRSYLTEDYISDLIRSAPLHDIGKVAIPDSILLKPGKLTEEEYLVIQSHPVHGGDILEKAEKRLSFPSFFKIAIQMSKSHHEKWDGTGYPLKLLGESIPLSARIMALADVYDALSTARPYKKAFSHETCISIIQEERGKSFDPELVDIFLLKENEFEEVSKRLKDA